MVGPQIREVDAEIGELRRRYTEERKGASRPEADADVRARLVATHDERARHRPDRERDVRWLAPGRPVREHDVDGAIRDDMVPRVRLRHAPRPEALHILP